MGACQKRTLQLSSCLDYLFSSQIVAAVKWQWRPYMTEQYLMFFKENTPSVVFLLEMWLDRSTDRDEKISEDLQLKRPPLIPHYPHPPKKKPR